MKQRGMESIIKIKMSDQEVNSSDNCDNKIAFKKKFRRNLRQRKNSSDDDNPADDKSSEFLAKLEETKERQRLRSRPHGVSIAGLASGKKLTEEDEITIKDPFSVKSGGMVNMQALKNGKMKQQSNDDAYDVGIGTQFSAETNKRDEDEEMMKYIEEELKKRKGVNMDDIKDGDIADIKYLTPEEAALYALPDHLRHSSSNRSEEMLSNQMLNGIPEVDLGIDAKIKNIEATEEAKQKLLQDQKNKKDGPSQFVPTNMAVNFMQHNRFNIEEMQEQRKRKKVAEIGPDKSATGTKKATDDYHYDKFKKQFRRY